MYSIALKSPLLVKAAGLSFLNPSTYCAIGADSPVGTSSRSSGYCYRKAPCGRDADERELVPTEDALGQSAPVPFLSVLTIFAKHVLFFIQMCSIKDVTGRRANRLHNRASAVLVQPLITSHVFWVATESALFPQESIAQALPLIGSR